MFQRIVKKIPFTIGEMKLRRKYGPYIVHNLKLWGYQIT